MTTPAYDVGDKRRLDVTFKNLSGEATDPTTVTLTVREPDGITTTKTWAAAEVQRTSAGVFYYDWPIAKKGRHVVRWVGAGAVETTERHEFWARG